MADSDLLQALLADLGAALFEALGTAVPARQLASRAGALASAAKAGQLPGLHYLCALIERGLGQPSRAGAVLPDDDVAALIGFVELVPGWLDGSLADADTEQLLAPLEGSSWWPPVPPDLRRLIVQRLGQRPWLAAAPAQPLQQAVAAAPPAAPATANLIVAEPLPAAPAVVLASVEPPASEPSASNHPERHAPAEHAAEAAEPAAAGPAGEPLVEPIPDPSSPLQSGSAPADPVRWISTDEIGLVGQALNEQLLPLAGQLASAPEFGEAEPLLGQLHDELALLGNAFEVMELPLLRAEVERVRTNLELYAVDADGWSPERASAMLDWGLNLAGWLAESTHDDLRHSLLESIASPAWLVPSADLDALPAEFASIRIGMDPSIRAARKSAVDPEDVQLQIAPDIAPEVVAGMLGELPGNVGELCERLQRLARSGDEEDIDVARRIAHTLKGDANIVGLRGIANLTHALEDILVELKKQPQVPPRELAGALLDAGDCVAAMADHVLGHGPAPEDALDVYQLILDWANRALDGSLWTDLAAPGRQAPAAAEDPVAQPGVAAASEPAPAEAEAEPVATMTVPVPLLNSLLQLSGEAIVLTRQLEQFLRTLTQQQREFKRGTSLFERLTTQLDDLVSLRGAALQSTRLAGDASVDALELDQYDELHTVSRRIQELSVDQRDYGNAAARAVRQLNDLVAQQDRLHTELQRHVLQTRKITMASIVPRLKRAVRQTARSLLKDCDLLVSGEDQEIDSDILSGLVDPLMHLVRNAVDHGIEDSAERRRLGKPETGRIELQVRQDGVHVTVELRDDGRGLDYERIRAKAERLGLVEEGEELDESELARLILLPGFSTREQTTQISGRGIGMDVVASEVRALKGTLSIDSQGGQGSHFVIRVPADLNTTQVLVASTAQGRVAVATDRLERLVLLSSHDVVQRDTGIGVRHLGSIVEGYELGPLCYGGEWRLAPDRASHIAMLYRNEQGRLRAVLAATVDDVRTVIVSRLGPYAPTIPGVRGATILGDGKVAPVIDLPELVADISGGRNAGQRLGAAALGRRARLPRALIADDSLSVRRALELLLRDAGYEVDAARDGLEALGMLNRHTPDVILLDLEMPKLNGLEVASFVRQTDQFKAIPVVMITSRTGARHREMATEAGVDLLLTKPYSDEYLLNYLQQRVRSYG